MTIFWRGNAGLKACSAAHDGNYHAIAVSEHVMLEVRGLTKRYATIPAVDNVSFTLRPGQVLGYLGPNGSGKSTTVKMLTGMIEPSSGEIWFGGRRIDQDMQDFKARLGYVPEEPHLYQHLTGREYLQLVG